MSVKQFWLPVQLTTAYERDTLKFDHKRNGGCSAVRFGARSPLARGRAPPSRQTYSGQIQVDSIIASPGCWPSPSPPPVRSEPGADAGAPSPSPAAANSRSPSHPTARKITTAQQGIDVLKELHGQHKISQVSGRPGARALEAAADAPEPNSLVVAIPFEFSRVFPKGRRGGDPCAEAEGVRDDLLRVVPPLTGPVRDKMGVEFLGRPFRRLVRVFGVQTELTVSFFHHPVEVANPARQVRDTSAAGFADKDLERGRVDFADVLFDNVSGDAVVARLPCQVIYTCIQQDT